MTASPSLERSCRRFRIDLSSRPRRHASSWPRASSCHESITAGTTNVPTATSGESTQKTGWLDRIVKVDVAEGRTIEWREESCSPGEPVFVAAPDAEAEDDGVLLSVVFDSRSGRSFMLVLDAADLTELARAEAPHHIPYGFHGQFVGEDAPSERPV